MWRKGWELIGDPNCLSAAYFNWVCMFGETWFLWMMFRCLRHRRLDRDVWVILFWLLIELLFPRLFLFVFLPRFRTIVPCHGFGPSSNHSASCVCSFFLMVDWKLGFLNMQFHFEYSLATSSSAMDLVMIVLRGMVSSSIFQSNTFFQTLSSRKPRFFNNDS